MKENKVLIVGRGNGKSDQLLKAIIENMKPQTLIDSIIKLKEELTMANTKIKVGDIFDSEHFGGCEVIELTNDGAWVKNEDLKTVFYTWEDIWQRGYYVKSK